jgi:hypothetical protein
MLRNYIISKGVILVSEQKHDEEPTIAPGMNTHDSLEEKPTEEERQREDYTEVTRLYLDRTPED